MRTHTRRTHLFLAFTLLTPALAMASDVRTQEAGAQGTEAQKRPAAEPERAPAPPPIEVGFSGLHLVVEPRVSGVATSVYVSCADGTYIHRELEGVGAALVEVVREDGEPVADGRCKYEIYVHPPVDKVAMRIAEERDDLATIERLSRIEQAQTVISRGVFRMAGGAAAPLVERPSDP
ncbi:MAG TPA: hypothetical protein VMM81_02370 [Acidimicrobiia bacterium]|nr:hypothetical protein [Acidimicrobiia bacterium]